MLNQETFRALTNVKSDNCVSIYVPGHPTEDGKESRSFLKRMLSEATAELKDRGMSDKDARKFLFNAYELLNQDERWKNIHHSYAIFIAEGYYKSVKLSYETEPQVFVGPRFYLRQALPAVNNGAHFYLLALSEEDATLYKGNNVDLQPMAADEQLPDNMKAALMMDTPDRNVQMNSGSAAFETPIFDNDEMGSDHRLKAYKRYCYQVDLGVQEILKESDAPLVLATTDQIAPIYKETSDIPDIPPVHISGNPTNLDESQLHKQAVEIIHEFQDGRRKQVIRVYSDHNDKDLASSSVFEIVPRAHKGDVDTLLIADGHYSWGTYNEKTRKVELHKERQKDSVDLIDLAAAYAHLSGAKVYTMPQDKLPQSGTSVNAIYHSGS